MAFLCCHYIFRDSKGVFAAVLVVLSKAFDCILHELPLAKLNVYGFDETSLTFMYSYLSPRQQKTKVGFTFRELMDILFGVPLGSILGPLLFMIYICDLFILNDQFEFGSYADDTIGELEKHTAKISEWFLYNYLKANAKTFCLFLSPFIDKAINIENVTRKSSYAEVLLGATIDRNLSFK